MHSPNLWHVRVSAFVVNGAILGKFIRRHRLLESANFDCGIRDGTDNEIPRSNRQAFCYGW